MLNMTMHNYAVLPYLRASEAGTFEAGNDYPENLRRILVQLVTAFLVGFGFSGDHLNPMNKRREKS